MLKKIPFLLLSLLLISCGTIHESPVIYLSNASLKPIKNINCEWSKRHVLSLSALNPGESRSQSFYIKDDAAFFGLVKVSWTNDEGSEISREFFFRKTDLPSIDDPKAYNYAQLYFDQHSVEISTSDAPDLSEKTVKMDQLLLLYRDQYAKEHKAENLQIINVQYRRDNSAPALIFGAY